MHPRYWILCGALLAAAGVAAGAFHSHGLEAFLNRRSPDPAANLARMEHFELAVQYHLVHALGLVLCGLLGLHRPNLFVTLAGLAFLTGIALFSGGLYLRALGSDLPLPHLIPAGGVAYILGWLLAAVAALRLSGGSQGR